MLTNLGSNLKNYVSMCLKAGKVIRVTLPILRCTNLPPFYEPKALF